MANARQQSPHQESGTGTTRVQNPRYSQYPGLELHLRSNDKDKYGFFPIGAHGSNYESDSLLLFIRELAVMDVMEKLTDKFDWHKKVFDEDVTNRRQEALAIPDEELYKLARSGKHQWWDEEYDDNRTLHNDRAGAIMPEDILDECSFAFVSKSMLIS